MAGDKKQFGQSMAHWQELLVGSSFSVPRMEGAVAIVASAYEYHKAPQHNVADQLAFQTEATEIGQGVEEYGRAAKVILEATADDLDAVIQDPTVTDIVTIGNGGFSYLYMDGVKGEQYDWHRAARMTTHLKTGQFFQRQCGLFSRRLNVPLGTFVVSDFTGVHAVRGDGFYPDSLDDVENAKVQPIFPEGIQLTYRGLTAYSLVRPRRFSPRSRESE